MAARGEKVRPRNGVVVEIGPWRKTKSGFAILPDIKLGDTVIISEYLTTKLNRGIGENLRLCKVDDVLALLT